ncbi:hypothetical protein HispidOSU_019415 [Sigmodon hispidus]
MFTSAPAAPSKQHAEPGVRCPKVFPWRLFTGGASERFRLRWNPEVTWPDVETAPPGVVPRFRLANPRSPTDRSIDNFPE